MIKIMKILAVAFVSFNLCAMNEDSFMCKVSARESERSLPAGAMVPQTPAANAGVLIPTRQIDAKKRAEKVAELNSEATAALSWDKKKKLLKDAIQNFGIRTDEIMSWIYTPLEGAFWVGGRDDALALFLLECEHMQLSNALTILRGRKISNTGYRSNNFGILKYVLQSIKRPKFAHESSVSIMCSLNTPLEEQSILLAHRHGANPADLDEEGKTALMSLLYKYARDLLHTSLEKYCSVAGTLVKIGVPLDVRVGSGRLAGRDYQGILNFIHIQEDEKKMILAAITQAQQKNEQARAQFLAITKPELSKHLPIGAKNIKGNLDDIVIGYVGHIVPDDVLAEIEEVDKRADAELARLRAINAREDESEKSDSKCVIS